MKALIIPALLSFLSCIPNVLVSAGQSQAQPYDSDGRKLPDRLDVNIEGLRLALPFVEGATLALITPEGGTTLDYTRLGPVRLRGDQAAYNQILKEGSRLLLEEARYEMRDLCDTGALRSSLCTWSKPNWGHLTIADIYVRPFNERMRRLMQSASGDVSDSTYAIGGYQIRRISYKGELLKSHSPQDPIAYIDHLVNDQAIISIRVFLLGERIRERARAEVLLRQHSSDLIEYIVQGEMR